MLARLGLDLKLMGKKEMQEFLRVTLSNVHDLLVDELGDGPLAGAMAPTPFAAPLPAHAPRNGVLADVPAGPPSPRLRPQCCWFREWWGE